MSITEVKHEIYKILMEKDMFHFPNDNKRIFFISDQGEELRDSVILAALQSLQEIKLIRKCDTWWVLEKSAAETIQTVDLSPRTCSFIAQIINDYRKAKNIEEDQCDPCNITERDIQNVCMIVGHISRENSEGN